VGFWYAREKGYYLAEGLDVDLLPGGVDSSPTRAVATRSSEFGQVSGLEQLLAAVENGLQVTLIAAIHRQSPHAIVSLGARIVKPEDLIGKRVAVAFGDAAEVHFRALLKSKGIREGQLQLVPFRFALQPLVLGEVDAVTGFSTDQPVTLRSQGLSPSVLAYRDLGIDRYGYCLISGDRVPPETARRFLAASRRGWEDAFREPEAAIQVLRKVIGESVDTGIELEKLKEIRPLMLAKDGSLAEWSIDPEKLREAKDLMMEYGLLKSDLSLEGTWKNP